MINLLEGKPAVELLPRNRIACSFQVAITAENAVTSMLQYGHERGNELYLDRLARFLTRNYGTFVSVEHLCATPGASLSLQHLLTILTRPTSSTRFAFFQDPTYHLVYKIFSDVGFRRDQFVSIPDDKDGLDTDHLASFLKKHMEKYGAAHGSNNNEYSAVLYCVPTHANPSSTIMSAERREKLVRLAREYNVLIICDDVYEFLTYDADVILPKRVVAYDIDTMDSNQQKPVVVSNGSFSKILAPGMRAGWIEAHPDLIKRIGICGSFFSGGSPSNFANEVIAPMLDEKADPVKLSLEGNMKFLREKLRKRRDLLCSEIANHLVPLGCSMGINRRFLQATMAKHPDKERLIVGWGNLFGVPDTENFDQHRFGDHIRLCFAYLHVEELTRGIKHLADFISLTQGAIAKIK